MTPSITVLMAMTASFMHLPLPQDAPIVKLVPQQQIAALVCKKQAACSDIFFFYAHNEGIIYVTNKVDFKFTFSQGELIREIGRHILYKNKIYHPGNTCDTNTKLESSLQDMEFDFLTSQMKIQRYSMIPGGGIPKSTRDLGKRIWFCNPKATIDIDDLIKV